MPAVSFALTRSVATLRYDKRVEDSFEQLWQHAMHLFTAHESLRTSKLNINFIFSGDAAHQTQWNYLYSRLPYVLAYAWRLIEHVLRHVAATDTDYLDDVERRTMAGVTLWWPGVSDPYATDELEPFAHAQRRLLLRSCAERGCGKPTSQDLLRMFERGAWPGESRVRVAARDLGYTAKARLGRAVRYALRSKP